ncbi:MAG: insulinase family protein [Acidobacteriota bacterium]|jgi:zinc protease|nr:insulinase family protein [Acidobacteriota bacterium]
MFRKTRLGIAICFLFTLTAATATGQGRAPSRGAPKPAQAPFLIEAESHEESQRVTKTVFKNGLTALVYEFYGQPLVTVQTYVPGGFLDDPDEAAGLSEITARSRENVGAGSPAGTTRRRAQALGGVFSGRAGLRHSRFELTVPAARWKQALNIHAEALLPPFENNEAFRLYAARIVENMRDEFVPPDVLSGKELRALAFGERRFAPSGHLPEIAPEKIIEFHKNRYNPSAMTLVIAGDVRAGDVLNEIARLFVSKGAGSKNAPARAAAPPAGAGIEPIGGFRYLPVPGDIVFPQVLLGFPVSFKNPEDHRALEVAAAILGTGETSVLNTRLRDRKDLIFSARAEMESFHGAGFFSVMLETQLQHVDMTEIAFWTEVEILKRNGPSEAELARAVAQLERLWWERRETVGGLADALAGSEFQGGWKRMNGYIAELQKVTAVDVRRAIARHLTLSNCALLEYLPRSAADRNPAGTAVRATLESLLGLAADEELSARKGEVEPNFKIPSATAPLRLNEIRHSFQAASILRGPEIYIREDHTSPLVEMGVYFTGGKAQESEADAGITGLMLELMLRNERENRRLEIFGGRLTPVVADDYFGFYLSIPSRNFPEGFERIKQVIKSPVFDKAEIEKLKQLAAMRARRSTARDEEKRLLNEALFHGHSYAAESSATPVSLKNISVETMQNWYEENVRNVKPFVAIAGNTEGTSLASWFLSEFSGSRMKDRKKISSPPGPVKKAETVNYNGEGGRPAILMGFRAPSLGDMDVFGTYVLKSYLENRLGETEGTAKEIQERARSGLRITCEYRPFLAAGRFIIHAAIKAGEEAQAMKNLQEALARLNAPHLPYADFNEARTLAAGLYMAGNQTRKAQIGNLAENLLSGRSLEEYMNFSRNIEQVEEDDFKELTRRVIDMNKAVTLAVDVPGAGGKT